MSGDGRSSVLVIDDVDDLRLMIRLALEDAGYTVLEAPTGAEGLRLLRDEPPDLVLLDIRLPDMSGWDVLRRLARKGTPVRVLVVSAHTSPRTFERALTFGCIGYVVKPFLAAELLREVERALLVEPKRIASVGVPDEED